ncbi:hypothetical protein [Paraburkholderia phytofirmans]|uniref:hypothetical protein n=1 Tax=Paraburkholderia phytofirmans TaxID=261302 RepID=UPI0038B9BE43
MLSLRVSLDDTDAGRDPIAGARKRTIENDDGHAGSTRHDYDGKTRRHGGNAMRDSLLLEWKRRALADNAAKRKAGVERRSGGMGKESRRFALSD